MLRLLFLIVLLSAPRHVVTSHKTVIFICTAVRTSRAYFISNKLLPKSTISRSAITKKFPAFYGTEKFVILCGKEKEQVSAAIMLFNHIPQIFC
jgi:N-acetyl-gamma-glutamylphosphate reductase